MSLNVPEDYHLINIMAIDPGLNNTGIAIYTFDFKAHEIVQIQTFLLNVDRLVNHTGFNEETVSERTVKLHKIAGAMKYLLEQFNPYFVVSESPFYNPRMPGAYGALLEVLNTIRTTVLDYNHNIVFSTIEPRVIKKTVGAVATEGKLAVKEAVKRIPDIMSKLMDDIEPMDEHRVDATAVGYTFLKLNGG